MPSTGSAPTSCQAGEKKPMKTRGRAMRTLQFYRSHSKLGGKSQIMNAFRQLSFPRSESLHCLFKASCIFHRALRPLFLEA